jgi:prolyl-tRNA synthetase
MYAAYQRIFTRCGLTFRAVEAQAGEIGGDVNHEFMAVAAIGEDDFVWCTSCEYAANVEAARRHSRLHQEVPAIDAPAREAVHTPELPGIAGVAAHLGVEASELLKCIAFEVDGELGLALVPGDREVNPYALAQAVAPRTARLYTDDDFAARPDLPKGYIGPDFTGAALVVADPLVGEERPWVTGANETDFHVDLWSDLVSVVSGDPCPRCGSDLSVDRGIEVGHVFQLGTKYSEALDATYTDAEGGDHPMVMGCYGIGVGRTVAASIEQNHDERGIIWPMPIAPFQVLITLVNPKDEAVRTAGEQLYAQLQEQHIEVLLDDRDERPGSKFADADLLGIPLRVTVGSRALQEGAVELQERRSGERRLLPVAAACETLAGLVNTALAAGH